MKNPPIVNTNDFVNTLSGSSTNLDCRINGGGSLICEGVKKSSKIIKQWVLITFGESKYTQKLHLFKKVSNFQNSNSKTGEAGGGQNKLRIDKLGSGE